jgi:hypothetical protein
MIRETFHWMAKRACEEIGYENAYFFKNHHHSAA